MAHTIRSLSRSKATFHYNASVILGWAMSSISCRALFNINISYKVNGQSGKITGNELWKPTSYVLYIFNRWPYSWWALSVSGHLSKVYYLQENMAFVFFLMTQHNISAPKLTFSKRWKNIHLKNRTPPFPGPPWCVLISRFRFSCQCGRLVCRCE